MPKFILDLPQYVRIIEKGLLNELDPNRTIMEGLVVAFEFIG